MVQHVGRSEGEGKAPIFLAFGATQPRKKPAVGRKLLLAEEAAHDRFRPRASSYPR